MSTLGDAANQPPSRSVAQDASATQLPGPQNDGTSTAALSSLADRFHSEALTFVQANPGVTSRGLVRYLLSVRPAGVEPDTAIDFLENAGCRLVSDTVAATSVDGYLNARWWPPSQR